MNERTPTTQEHWERYADELLTQIADMTTDRDSESRWSKEYLDRALAAEARVKELEAEVEKLANGYIGLIANNLKFKRESEARVKALEKVLRELMAWGLEYDNPNIGYITVQVDRPTIALAERALRGEEKK
jgi:hypothetical protein